jgi:hypothetical protein
MNIYAQTFLAVKNKNDDVDRQCAAMSTYREAGWRHGFQSGNKEKHGVVMTDTFKAYTLDAARLPRSTLAWTLYGAGTDNIGRSAKPEECEIPSTARNQPLVRVDSVSLCCSDVKVLRQCNTHTKIRGRNLRAKAAKVDIEPKQDSGFFENLGANNETRVSVDT